SRPLKNYPSLLKEPLQVAIDSATRRDGEQVQPSLTLVNRENDPVFTHSGGAAPAGVGQKLRVGRGIGRELPQARSNPHLGWHVQASGIGARGRVYPDAVLHRRPSSFSKSHSTNSPRARRSSAAFTCDHSSGASSSF